MRARNVLSSNLRTGSRATCRAVRSDDGECLQNEKSTPSGALFILARVDRKDAKSFFEISVFFDNSCISFGLQISISYDLPTVCK